MIDLTSRYDLLLLARAAAYYDDPNMADFYISQAVGYIRKNRTECNVEDKLGLMTDEDVIIITKRVSDTLGVLLINEVDKDNRNRILMNMLLDL